MSERKPLWPIPIEVFGITGEHESGKTTMAITACPGNETLVYDFEKSSKPYENDLGFVRVDVPDEMQAKFKGKAKPIDVFKWWVEHIRSIPRGQYRVIVVDPASDIEQGLADYVASNPREFNRTPGQYMKMSGLMWGDMKAYWKNILADIAARCETFFFVVHMGTVWKGDKPSKERKAKGKATLFELASLYLKMERNKDKSVRPSAVVLKTRLSKMQVNQETGEVDIKPVLPPRIPVATPHAIRQYCLKPADYDNLKPEELIGQTSLTEDEKLMLRAEIAEAERDTALANNEIEERQTKRLGGVSNRPVSSTESVEDASADTTQVADDEGQEEPSDSGAADDSQSDEAHSEDHPTETQSEFSESETITGETIQNAMDTAKPPEQPALDTPISKAKLASLNRVIARFVKNGGKQEVILRGIKKRNPRAEVPGDLTWGQANDLEAALLKVLDGPHEQPAGQEVAAAAASKS